MAVGTISSRKKILSWLISKNIKVISAIHPSVIISSDAKVGKGLIIGANSVVYGNTKICSGTFIGPSVTISHDTIIGKYCLISVGSVIGARVIIKNEVFVGSGTVITPKKLSSDSIIKVKKNSIIGAGSLVIEDVKIRDKIAGVPAKSLILKKNIKSKRRL